MLAMLAMLAIAIFAVAVLYSSVGHAGASGYIAAMALVTQMPQEEMKAVALTLNIFVGAIGAYQFRRHFHWGTLWPFGLFAPPMAFVGGMWKLPSIVFDPLIGSVLLFSAIMMAHRVLRKDEPSRNPRMPHVGVAVLAGGLLGLLAGLTGTGGGIFLSPLLILCGWADPKRTAAVSVLFVLLNSIAGLGGVIASGPVLPPLLWLYVVAAVAGGVIGSTVGAHRLPGSGIRLLLSVVLAIAAAKMFITAFG